MEFLTDIQYHYIACLTGVFLATKILVIRFILRKVRVYKTRNLLVMLAFLFSPTCFTLNWLFHLGFELLVISALAAYWIDLAIVNWIRAIFEPADALDDLEYDNSITNF